MVDVYARELRASWSTGLQPAQVKTLKHALGGAREALALLERDPSLRQRGAR
jgi:hypothetical protein